MLCPYKKCHYVFDTSRGASNPMECPQCGGEAYWHSIDIGYTLITKGQRAKLILKGDYPR